MDEIIRKRLYQGSANYRFFRRERGKDVKIIWRDADSLISQEKPSEGKDEKVWNFRERDFACTRQYKQEALCLFRLIKQPCLIYSRMRIFMFITITCQSCCF